MNYRSTLALLCAALFIVSGCESRSPNLDPLILAPVESVPGDDPFAPRSRYSFNNQCFAMQSLSNGMYVTRDGDGYSATAADVSGAEAFFMKPSSLGSYLLYNRLEQLLTDTGGVSNVTLPNAVDGSIWSLRALGDTTEFPDIPKFNTEPTPAEISTYRMFIAQPDEADEVASSFAFTSASDPLNPVNLVVDETGTLTLAEPSDTATNQQFVMEAVTGCTQFPEASANVVGESLTELPTPALRGTFGPDEQVLGMVDAHVHISSSEFLGQGQWGNTVHKFGVTHALDDCDEYHGSMGELDAIGGLFTMDTDGHDTTGWPTFPEWPARNSLLHEAIYWKWLERAWFAGLRIAVNDLVDNETLCELQRNVARNPTLACNSMTNAMEQAGTMFAMQDYIDAQYGGRGAGWFRIVFDSAEARRVVEEGKMAVVLGIEISNLLDCKIKYRPTRMQEPKDETGTGPTENSYGCTRESIIEQMDRMWGVGVRQVISIHEFDNAFGGNGIFDGLVLNLGNRENSGGIPGQLVDPLTTLGVTDPSNNPLSDPFRAGADPVELPTGEFWTTYDCPREDDGEGDPELDNDGDPFSGYLFGNSGGAVQEFSSPPMCMFMGQGGRPGGSTPCYPSGVGQCNARWMTPIGLYTYGKMMDYGFIFDWDHMEYEMKSQALDISDLLPEPYPMVSTHGNFGGTSIEQATRLVQNGGVIYPSLNNGPGHIGLMDEMEGVFNAAVSSLAPEDRPLFGFGFGTDTNGLSAQASPRSAQEIAEAGAVDYPYTLFSGDTFDDLPEFNNIPGVTFEQPAIITPDGEVQRTWSLDEDGSATFGMLSGMVEEVRLHGTSEHMRHLFNSAEAYLRMWEATEAASAAIPEGGVESLFTGDNAGNQDLILRSAPVP